MCDDRSFGEKTVDLYVFRLSSIRPDALGKSKWIRRSANSMVSKIHYLYAYGRLIMTVVVEAHFVTQATNFGTPGTNCKR